jgi:hypothetical protein
MRWRRGRMDDNDAMAMGGQRHAERSRAPRHPSETTINLCRQFGEESTRERDNFGGGDHRKGSRWRRLNNLFLVCLLKSFGEEKSKTWCGQKNQQTDLESGDTGLYF